MLRTELFMKVLVVVVSQVRVVDADALGVVDVFLVGLRQQPQLVSELQKRPVLETEIGEERLVAADVANVLDRKDVQVVSLLFLVVFLVVIAVLLLFRRLFCNRRLEALLLPLPHLERLQPLGVLVLEPLRRLQVLDLGMDLLIQHDGPQVLLALRCRLPLVPDLIEAFAFLWDREMAKRLTHRERGEVGLWQRPEFDGLLFRGQLDAGRLIVVLFFLVIVLFLFGLHRGIVIFCLWLVLQLLLGVVLLLLHLLFRLLRVVALRLGLDLLSLRLFLASPFHVLDLLFHVLRDLPPIVLGLLPHIIQLLLAQLDLLFPLLLSAFGIPLGVHFLLLRLQDELSLSGPVFCARLPHHDVRNALVRVRAEAPKSFRSLVGQEVSPHLHDDVIPWDQRRHRSYHALHAEIVHAKNAIVEVGLVV
mmetsp:Transcript_122898/g.347397  ORF Transcript_122898/g.347397 Transcript_122898/m.347397 type:complete len:419 (-) Transcript_122898:562-1818(-)